MPKHGFDGAEWERAKSEGKAALAECARNERLIAYSDFIKHVRSISFQNPRDPRLAHFLGEISTEEAQAARGMLTALVVRKQGEHRPGPGFFDLAEKLGYKTHDVEKFWVEEVKKVFAYWQRSA